MLKLSVDLHEKNKMPTTQHNTPRPKRQRTRPEAELYKLPDLDAFIEKERRKDELERLHEVRKQKRAWTLTFIFCALLNLVFLSLGIIGWLGVRP